jgi:hypothetical protein
MKSQDRIFHLLEQLKALNAASPGRGTQEIASPDTNIGPIATLEEGFLRKLSPMLEARFRFCGAWTNAHLSQDWLSLEQIRNWRQNRKLVEWVNLSKENSYDSEPPGGVEPKNCAIFGYNPHEPEETYLVWDDNEIEPKVWSFFQGDYGMFDSLQNYLEFIVGERSSDDSGR